MKKQLLSINGISPVYHRLFFRALPTYETATTRQFYHGRTETVRSCTMETLELAKTLTDSKIADKTVRNYLQYKVRIGPHLNRLHRLSAPGNQGI